MPPMATVEMLLNFTHFLLLKRYTAMLNLQVINVDVSGFD